MESVLERRKGKQTPCGLDERGEGWEEVVEGEGGKEEKRAGIPGEDRVA